MSGELKALLQAASVLGLALPLSRRQRCDKMADPVGMLASCVAVAGLAIRVVKTLDDLISRWDAAHLSLESLKSVVVTFTNSLKMLSLWMEREYLNSGAATDLTFVRNLALSCEGCMRFLLALKIELELVAPNPGRFSWRRKTAILWNENRIRDLRDHLMAQNQGLLLLLECRQLSRQQDAMREPSNQQTMNQVRNDTTKLLGETPSGLVTIAAKSTEPGTAGIDPAKVRDNIAPYNDYLSFLSQVTALEESNISSSSEPPNLVMLPNATKIREEYHKGVSNSSDFIVPGCPRLRILIIGQQGVGKSTICSKVLGISAEQAGVSHRGTGTAVGQVWEEITGPQNPHLVLHDSGGFRPNSNNEMDQIKAFIKFRREQKLLKDQLHCIWYCISSVGSRNLQDDGVEGDFFKLDTGHIPVFVIFTKFDLLIKEHGDAPEEEDPALPPRTTAQKIAIGEQPAFDDYKTNMESKIISLARGKPQVKICRVAIRKDKGQHKEYKLPEYRVDELVGLNSLIKEVAKDLEGDDSNEQKKGKLADVWIAGQRYNADMKLKASLQGCIDQYWRVQKVSKIPIIPIICLWTMGEAYSEILKRLTQYWGLTTKPEGLLTSTDNLRFGFLEATYDAPKETLIMNSYLLASYNFGPLLGSRVAKTILKMITGLTLIFERLFLIQQKQGENPEALTREIIREEASKFQLSTQRQMMNEAIEKKIVLSNCYQIAAAKTAASNAIRAGKSKDAEKFSTGEDIY
ncbi:hypothetical protein B7494_g6023 [Chlorociboria aeruginascens]|nr:hypothetical protein B7494_g6023 [Chlorociboria aeruginascens]